MLQTNTVNEHVKLREEIVSHPIKYDTYCSYHVTVTIDSVLFHGALSCLMSSEAWPMGMLVRRFFIKKE